jgi:hypothetical protein
MTRARFSSVLAWGIGVLGLASLLSGFVASIFLEPSPRVRSSGNNSFSRSALGHHAFVELLRRSGMRVRVSRYDSGDRAGRGSLLLLLEPDASRSQLRDMMSGLACALVVLPKRYGYGAGYAPEYSSSDEGGEDGDDGEQSPEFREGWLRYSDLVDIAEPQRLLRALGSFGQVVRWDQPVQLRHAGRDVILDEPQLIRSPTVEPIISAKEGTLFGVTYSSYGSTVGILSDPDLIQNHGIGDGENAPIVLSILRTLMGNRESVVIDETLHGFEIEPNLWRALGRFPLVLALMQALLFVLVLIWIASRRLGVPRREKPELEPGRMALIHSSADLLLQGGYSRSALRRYLDNEERRVASMRRLARSASKKARRKALLELESRNPPSVSLAEIAERIENFEQEDPRDRTPLLEAARAIHTWRMEMLHGAH